MGGTCRDFKMMETDFPRMAENGTKAIFLLFYLNVDSSRDQRKIWEQLSGKYSL